MNFSFGHMAGHAHCWCILAATLWVLNVRPGFAQPRPGEVPVLCYHQIRTHRPDDGQYARSITVPPAVFASHMQMLHDSGYSAITPDELYAWYTTGRPLPKRPVLITFDDNTSSQYTQALPALDQYGFKATFFVMTVTIGKPGYMKKDQLIRLVQQGHTLGCHTWDHQNMKGYQSADWKKQLDQPLRTLGDIAGDTIRYFAYPFGSWTASGAEALRQRGIQMAFILHTPASPQHRLFTVRRLMVGAWPATMLANRMRTTFHLHPADHQSRR